MAKKHHLPPTEDTSFCIDGKSCYLLQHPLSWKSKTLNVSTVFFLIWTQEPSYYTKRSNYPSFLLLYTYEGMGELIYRDSVIR